MFMRIARPLAAGIASCSMQSLSDADCEQRGATNTVWSCALTNHGLEVGKYKLALRVINPWRTGLPLRFANSAQDADVSGWLTLLPGLPGLGSMALDEHDRVGMERYRRPNILKAILPCGRLALKAVKPKHKPLDAI